MRQLVPLLLGLCTAAGCSQHPTSPSLATDGLAHLAAAFAEEGASTTAARSLAGCATDVLTGAGAAGVAIRIDGVADLAADANGSFALESEAPGGRYPVTVSGAKRRRTPDVARVPRRHSAPVPHPEVVQSARLRRDGPSSR